MLLSSCGSLGPAEAAAPVPRSHPRRELVQFLIHCDSMAVATSPRANVTAVACDQGAQFGVFHGQFTNWFCREMTRIGEKAADFLESLIQFLEFAGLMESFMCAGL